MSGATTAMTRRNEHTFAGWPILDSAKSSLYKTPRK